MGLEEALKECDTFETRNTFAGKRSRACDYSISKRDNTSMAPTDDALAEPESLEPGEEYSCRKIAAKYGVVRSTFGPCIQQELLVEPIHWER